MPDVEHLRLLTPDVKTVIWISQNPLSTSTEDFETLNYVLDGLPFKHLEAQGQTDSVVFSQSAFTGQFWVLFLQESDTSKQFIKTQIESIIPQDALTKILVLGAPSAPLKEWLTKNYSIR